MRTTTAALLGSVCGLLLANVPAAQANHDFYHHGGCSFWAVSDGTDSPSTRWDGEIDLAVVAADKRTWAPSGEPLTVECFMRVNGVAPGTVVLAASGTGAVAKVEPFTYYADPDDIVSTCIRVTTPSDVIGHCNEAVGRPLLPPAIDEPVRAAVDEAEALADSVTCLVLVGMDGGPADQPPLDIRTDGDLYVAGEWIWDCRPWGTSGT